MIPLYVPCLQGREWEYVKQCLDTGWVSSVGAFVDRFEEDFAATVNARHAVATASGTAALHTALLVAGVRPGDEVLVSSLTFIAPANAIRYCGAHPVFIDSDRDHWQMDPQLVGRFLDEECEPSDKGLRNRHTGRPVRAIVPVDLYGHPAPMKPIAEAARRHGLVVVEDASESLGALYEGVHVGQHADVSCYSFNGNKIITTGGGGMLTTNNPEWASRARYLTTQAKDDPVEYIHDEIGYNYRMTNVQAAIGLAQLEHLPEFIDRKRGMARAYADMLADVSGVRSVHEAPWATATAWLVNVEVDGGSRGLLRHLQEQDIQSRPIWRPVHQQKPYGDAQVIGGHVAAEIHQCGLSLPSSAGLKDEEAGQVARAIGTWASLT